MWSYIRRFKGTELGGGGMTISKERIEELRNKILVQLKTDLDNLLNGIIDEAGKDPLKFLFKYIEDFKWGCKGMDSYLSIDFPLSTRDFTEEELKYLKFYEND